LLPEPFYRTAARLARQRGEKFTCAKMFWWFNQGSGCDFSVTPKPHYGSDGSKEFDILSEPPELATELLFEHGLFPFAGFWGPRAGLSSSAWIARATAHVIRKHQPTLTLCYLPHLDYELQRKGAAADTARLVREVDGCAAEVIRAAEKIGAAVLVVSEYGIAPVSRAVTPNRALREAGLLRVRKGPYGEMLDVHESRAFAVCDHQAAHVYVRDAADMPAARGVLASLAGVAQVLDRDAQRALQIDHVNAGELVVLSQPDAWFAYPYWLGDANAPDFARSVDIHRKCGYDPCELFMAGGMAGAAWTLLKKKLGLRYRFRTCPLDPSVVKGSHGLPPSDPANGPIIASSESLPQSSSMTDVKEIVLGMLG
jgi:predicted AlkP superfamily pyrophosphatase or phosphodiesterase